MANQGYSETGYIENTTLEACESMMRVNYLGHVAPVQAALPHVCREDRGSVCLVSSMLGFFGAMGYSAYAASKHAAAGFAKCLRAELAPLGIGVTVAYVPTTRTPGLERENRTKPADVWALEASSQTFAPAVVARAIVRAVARRHFEVTPGLSSLWIWLLYRWFPSLVNWVMDRDVARFRRQELAVGRDPSRPALAET